MVYGQVKKLKVVVDKALNPYTRLLQRLGIKPIHLTILSLPTGVAGAILVFSKPTIAFPLLITYFTLDFTDGMLARHTKNETRLGEILDYNIDRLIAVTFLLNIHHTTGAIALPLVGLSFILMVTLDEIKQYLKTRGSRRKTEKTKSK